MPPPRQTIRKSTGGSAPAREVRTKMTARKLTGGPPPKFFRKSDKDSDEPSSTESSDSEHSKGSSPEPENENKTVSTNQGEKNGLLSEIRASGWEAGKGSGRFGNSKEFDCKDFDEAWAFLKKISGEAKKLSFNPEFKLCSSKVTVILPCEDRNGVNAEYVEYAGLVDNAAPDAPVTHVH